MKWITRKVGFQLSFETISLRFSCFCCCCLKCTIPHFRKEKGSGKPIIVSGIFTRDAPVSPGVVGGTPNMKGVGMLVVSLRGVNIGFWSHLGCSRQNAIIFSREGLV